MQDTGHRIPISISILDILRKHSDRTHHMRQVDIIDRLAEQGYKVTRKTVRRNLLSLKEAGHPVVEENGWYYEHDFCAVELDLLINSLLFNSAIPYVQCRQLIDKLAALGSEHYEPVYGDGINRLANPQFFYTLDTLMRACEEGLQVRFHYSRFDVDKQLHTRLDENGMPHEYLVNPYRVAVQNGRHYLVGNVDKYDTAVHFRIDRIQDIRLMKTMRKPMSQVKDFAGGLNLSQYISEHVYMYTGPVREMRIRADRSIVGDILESFGKNVQFRNVTEETVEALFRSDEMSIKDWLCRFRDRAELISMDEKKE